MPMDTLIALFALASAAAWTPGPNNVMLTASGANFGLRRTVPHMFGVAAGCFLMMFSLAFGLGALIASSPLLKEAMRWAGAALLIWFAWRIANAGRANAEARARPLTVWEAAGFQWVNPKAWAMMLATSSQFVTGENVLLQSFLCGLAFFISAIGATFVWSAFGVGIGRFLKHPARLRAFNLIMAGTLLGFVVYLFRDVFT